MRSPIQQLNPQSASQSPVKHHISPQLTSRAFQQQQQYHMKYQKWQQLRLRMKSMQLNKVQVTTYLNHNNNNNNNKHNINIRSDNQVKQGLQQKNGNQSMRAGIDNQSPIKYNNNNINNSNSNHNNNHNKELNGLSATQHRRVYTSKNRFKPGAQIYTGMPQSHLINKKQQQVNVKQAQSPVHMSLEHKIKRRTARQQAKHRKLNTSACLYIYNRDSSKQILNLKPKTRCKKVNKDLQILSKITTQDYLQRLIVRKKSNILQGRMEAIQASIIRGKIIMFTVQITEGEDQIKVKQRARSSNNSRRQIQVQKNLNRKVNTYAGSKQLKLILGPSEILQYIKMFGLSLHPLELQSSTTKIAVILVDYLEISDNGLKIDKCQIMSTVKNTNPLIKNINLDQKYKKLQSSELVRWKPNHHHHNNHSHNYGYRSQQQSRRTNHQLQQFRTDRHNQNTSHELYGQAGRFQAYGGHPHPKINSKQCSMLNQNNVPYQEIQVKEQSSNRNKDTISIGEQICVSHQNCSRMKSRN